MHDDLQDKRNRICEGLSRAGFLVEPPQGTYFVLADISPFTDKPDTEYVLDLIKSVLGVATIPVSVFYKDRTDIPTNYIRFCFAKQEQTLQQGLVRLKLMEA